MAGRIRDEDVALVRERARVDEVVREYVTLKSAGGGSLKGLCPFHDERSPSFHVTPSKGMWYCFGCGEGGDVISFVQKMDHLTFAEVVEKLAGRTGVELRYVEGGTATNRQQGQRTRLVEAHRVAAAFYQQQLTSPDAQMGREFLKERGFDAEAAAHFGVGFAPKGWDALTTHLRQKGFTDQELLAGGLVSQGNRGPYDRFRGRLVWPIRDLGGEVIGFGARKLFDDDEGPKYLNTPESPIYKKSQVLYGIDLARRDISKGQQAVIVEGYTDVMACHLAGITTAVATCGTSFGTDHIKVLRRLLMDDDQMKGSVIFTFDGDAAGQKAALRAFEEDQRFVSQTFVAVEPSGMDPCDLRIQQGDEAVQALVDRRVPLFEFAIRSTLAAYDLESAEGRINALRDAAPIVAKIRDTALRPEYARRLAGWLGMDVESVSKAVQQAQRSGRQPAPNRRDEPRADSPPPAMPRAQAGQRRDPVLVVEREALKCALQEPAVIADWYESVEETAFTHAAARRVHQAIAGAGFPSTDVTGLAWIDAVLEASEDDDVRRLVRELAVEPLPADEGRDDSYVIGVISRLLEQDASRRIEDLRGRMQRIDAVESPEDYNRAFADLLALEEYRRSLRQESLGTGA
ncbi:MAG: DNA primase [Candidatus Nanopelagicales bacterium]|nr:DNA primase [Candidatus Nanopelagicales bacterium]MCF8537597.1 DNA primase [Candidatus Nanopelagicales bacterium]MCF8542654.1 DNA primase [Candidatus Nanopelagicales bacterium]MCF8557966.1 DNA primase [Candidatus Nanopelagicales bacterium]